MTSEQTTLREWTQENVLPQVVFLNNETLEHQGTRIAANVPITLTHADKSCTYSAASLFLQLLHPGLVQYRQECKKHNVVDPVKATDKALVLAALGASAVAAPPAAVAAPTPVELPPPAAPPQKKQRKDKQQTHKQKHKDAHHKQPKQLVTNEQLFDRLNVVVDKRQQQERHEIIARALNTEGFQVTPELLDEHRSKTEIILQQEIPVGNSASILRAVNPQKDLSRVLELFLETTKSHHNSKRTTTTSTTTTTPSKQNNHLMGQKPVILVPKGMTAPLTLINAHEFLANAKYVPRQQQQQNKHRHPTTTFTRQVAGRWIEYEIMDNPRKLGNAWDRVVAVIVLGQSWQFKDWIKGYDAPATLFDQVYGFFLSLEGDQLPAEVTTWAVHVATVNRDKRGLDQVAYAAFWNGLDEWMKVRKPELLL